MIAKLVRFLFRGFPPDAHKGRFLLVFVGFGAAMRIVSVAFRIAFGLRQDSWWFDLAWSLVIGVGWGCMMSFVYRRVRNGHGGWLRKDWVRPAPDSHPSMGDPY